MMSLTLGLTVAQSSYNTIKAQLQALGKEFGDSATKFMDQMSSPEFKNRLATNVTNMGRIIRGQDIEGMSEEQKRNAAMTRTLAQGFGKLESTFKGMLTKSFDIVETIYKELRKSSPLLQAVEQLFNLAMQLFFMPLGNKLGEILIPAVIQLLDNVVAMWDEIGDGNLGDMFSRAISLGIDYLVEFLDSIGSELSKQGGLVGSIGRVLTSLSNFVDSHLENLVNLMLNITSIILNNFPLIVGAITTFMAMHAVLQLATIAAIASGSLPILGMVIGSGIAVGAGIAVAGMFAEGGKVPATPGGQLALVGEGGEDEYIIPESKMSSFGGNTYYITINSYTPEETENMVRSVIRDEVSASRLRSGF